MDKEINHNYICPKKSDVSINKILAYIFICIDLIFLCIPFALESSYIDENLLPYIPDLANEHLTTTNNTSNVQNNFQNINRSNFHKEPTETIIVGNIKNEKINISNDNIKRYSLNINNQISNLNNSKEINNNNNKIENNESKSNIQLIYNKNIDIFKAINFSIFKNGKK